MSGATAIVVFIVAIIVSIMIHELGHFLSARWFGMRADRYFLGFGPTLWSTRRGETEYGVKAFPLGGFVTIKGMSPLDERLRPVGDQVFDAYAVDREREREMVPAGAPAAPSGLPDETWERLEAELRRRGTGRELTDRIVQRTRTNVGDSGDLRHARTVFNEVVAGEVTDTGRLGSLYHRITQGDRGRFFPDRPAWQRAIVLVAGSVMHFLIAIAVLLAMFLFLPQPTGERDTTVDAVLAGEPAEDAGLQSGDRIVAIGGIASDDWPELRDVIRSRPGEPTEFVVERDGEQVTLTVTPRAITDEETGETVGLAGFTPSETFERYTVTRAIEEAFVGPVGFVTIFVGSLVALGRVFSPSGLMQLLSQASGAEERTVDGAVSLVGAASLAGQTSGGGRGLVTLLLLIVSINIFIGIFNLVPLPPLDGGHLAVLGIERAVNAVRGLRGKKQDYTVDPRAIAAVAIPVLAVLGTVFVALLWLDISNPLQLPG